MNRKNISFLLSIFQRNGIFIVRSPPNAKWVYIHNSFFVFFRLHTIQMCRLWVNLHSCIWHRFQFNRTHVVIAQNRFSVFLVLLSFYQLKINFVTRILPHILRCLSCYFTKCSWGVSSMYLIEYGFLMMIFIWMFSEDDFFLNF